MWHDKCSIRDERIYVLSFLFIIDFSQQMIYIFFSFLLPGEKKGAIPIDKGAAISYFIKAINQRKSTSFK